MNCKLTRRELGQMAAAGMLAPHAARRAPVDDIDPLIGATTEDRAPGKTFPGACRPFGMVQFSPDTITGGDNGSGYSYHHKTIEGFSCLHMSGVGAYGDLGNFLITPTVGALRTARGREDHPEEGYRSRFDHKDEHASAGYYKVFLQDPHVLAELTTTTRACIGRFTFPEAKPGRLQVDLSRRVGGTSLYQAVRVVGDHRIEGRMECGPEGGGWMNGTPDLKYTVYFVAEFSRPFTESGIWSAAIPEGHSRKRQAIESEEYQAYVRAARVERGGRGAEGKHIGFFAEWPTRAGEQILVRVGLSFVSIEGAEKNLRAELGHWNFDKVREQARADWARALGAIAIEGGDARERTIFHTAMYHALIDPRVFSDVDGQYWAADKRAHQSGAFTYRTIFSGWDVFRAAMPLLTLIRPDVVNDEVATLIENAELNGRGLPKWELCSAETGCMIGDPAIVTITDAYQKGLRRYDVERAYAACRRTALGPVTTRNDWEAYNRLGWAPGRVSVTLENCYADWCMAQFARALGHADDARLFSERAQNYRKIYDASAGFMHARDASGNWIRWEGETHFGQGCVESNPYQQHWFVPHDVDGLIGLMGRETFVRKLDELFAKSPASFQWNEYYNHSNEPVHHVAYLFNRAGAPHLTQKWVRTVMKQAYDVGPYGLCGNDDVGQMSAWYIFSAMGFYPICPGDNMYDLGSPVFDRVELRTPGGRAFTVRAVDNSPQNVYVQSVTLNGKPLAGLRINHKQITRGGELTLRMGPRPGPRQGR